jgi:transposase, IS30 family
MKEYRHLAREQRYSIQRLKENGLKQYEIAQRIHVDPSTVCRELKRNRSAKGEYSALGAHRRALSLKSDRAYLYKKQKIFGVLEELIRQKMKEGWSPQQISERLRREGREKISHEAIYRYVYMDKRQGGTLYQALRLHQRRRRRGGKRNRLHRKWTETRKFIDKRPQTAEKREEFGHWERDLVCGKMGTASLLTIVDRKSRYTVIRKVKTHSCDEVGDKTYDVFKKDKRRFPCASITNDNGIEFRKPAELESDLGVPIFFTHPYHSWERGTNENTNGLLRQFFPKSMDLTEITDSHISEVERLLNSRPRKTLGYKTPEEILFSKEQKLFKSKSEYQKNIRKRLDEIFNKWPYV